MAADGRIVIDVILDDGTVAKGVANIGNQVQGLEASGERAASGIGKIVSALGLAALGAKAIDAVKNALDGAISRFDTLSGFPGIMERMGFSTEQAKASIDALSNGIQGLPTTLDGIVKSTQNIAILTGDLEGATATALAMNNAFLASGSGADDAARGLNQYVQMLSKGEVDLQSWRTLQETMGFAINKTAEAFGFAGASAQNDLYAALKDGTVTFDQFNAKLIELNEGVGGFADIALTGSAGIATSFGNMKNAIVVGVANIITSFDKLAQGVTGKSIAQNLDGLKSVISNTFKLMGSAIEGAVPFVIAFADAVKAALPVVQALTPAVIGLIAAYAAYTAIMKASAAITAAKTAIALAEQTTRALTIATRAQVAAQVTMTTVDRAGTAATVAHTSAVTLSTYVIGVLTGTIKLSTVAKGIATAATYAWGAAIKFMLGPIGWVTAGIGLLVTGIIAAVSWFKKSTEEANRMNAETEKLGETTTGLASSLDESSRAHKVHQNDIKATAGANRDLIQEIETLSAKENKSAADKLLLSDSIERLNGSVDGLNLSYNEEANALSMSSEQLSARVKLLQDQETMAASQERLLEISKEQREVDMQMAEVNAMQEEWNQKKADGTVKAGEAKDALAELDVQEQALIETGKMLTEQEKLTEAQRTASIEAVTAAVESGVTNQTLAYERLSDRQMDIVDSLKTTWEDYKDQATNMFDTLSQKSELTIGEMTKNLEKNQEIIGKWSENIAKLAERGIDDGLLNTLRDAGPESAGHVNALVNASDSELKKLSDAFANGGDVATEALNTSLGKGNAVVMESVGHLVTEAGSTLTKQIKDADFASLGKAVPEGMAKGIEGGAEETKVASKKLAEDTIKAGKDALGINSPSKEFQKIGEGIPEGLVLGIDGGAPTVVAAIQKMLQSVKLDSEKSLSDIVKSHDTAVKELEKVLSKLPEVAKKAMTDMLAKLKEGTAPQVKVMTTLATDMIKAFNNLPTQMKTVGKEAMSGMNSGLNSGKSQVLSTAKGIADSVANTMRKALDIQSPSRVMHAIGAWTTEGLAEGIDSKRTHVEKIMNDIGYLILDITEHYASEEVKVYKKSSAEISKIAERSAQDIAKIHSTAKAKKRKLTQAEAIKIQRIEQDSAKKILDIRAKASKDAHKLATDADKEMLKEIKTFVDDKKSLEQLTLAEEAKIWKESVVLFEDGTKEKVEAQKNFKKAMDAINKEIESVNKSHADRITKINDELAKGIQKETDDFNKAYESKVDSILNFAGIFDEFVSKFDGSGSTLIKNLESQVNALEDWRGTLESLWGKIDDQALMEELEGLGPKAVGELKALNGMSEEQLAQFVELYNQKFTLARGQADIEMAGMKEDTEIRINEMREAANNELDIVHAEWSAAIQGIVRTTDTELKQLKTVGRQAGQGLLDGLASMEPALLAKARSIANAIKAEISKALDIRSPSRWMRDMIGRNMMLGWQQGMDLEKSATIKKANEAAGWMKPDIPSVSGFTNKLRGVTPPVGNVMPFSAHGGGNSSVTSSNSRSYSPTFQNYFTRDESSPSEVARKNKQQAQRQAMEWGLV